jgi:hypothetical protein
MLNHVKGLFSCRERLKESGGKKAPMTRSEKMSQLLAEETKRKQREEKT